MSISRNIHLAFDLGSSSGRLIMAWEANKTLYIEEIYRFKNEAVQLDKRLYWDFLRLFQEIKKGLKIAVALGYPIASIGIDTWGVDYGFLDASGLLMANPAHYRDQRTANIMPLLHTHLADADLFKQTGIQSMPINTLYQLYSDTLHQPDLLTHADRFLMMPDLFNFFLTGNKFCEYTIASTSQLLDIHSHCWSKPLLNLLGLAESLFPPLIQPGKIWGYLHPSLCTELGIAYDIPVIAVGSHDTASAVAATPLLSDNEAYLCCGSWSLLGVELPAPCLSPSAYGSGFTNEGGVNQSYTFLKNINGLWFFQRLRESPLFKTLSFEQISQAAASCESQDFCIDVSDPSFLYHQRDMASAVADYCAQSNQGRPTSPGQIALAIYKGLVKECADAYHQLETILGHSLTSLHLVGGGVQDKFLCQSLANALNLPVVAGPKEASALGNVLMQLYALGNISSLEQGRRLIQHSFSSQVYSPERKEF